MSPVVAIARQEIVSGLRNKWVAASVGAMVAVSLTLALLGSAPAGEVGASPLAVVLASLSGLSVFLVPLIALLLAHDAIAGEAERGTLLLTLAYPVARWQFLGGKFLGHTAILALAVVLGFGAAAAAVIPGGAAPGEAGWLGLITLIASAIAMGAVFLALGYLTSALVAERSTAVGIAVGLWLLFAIVYDLAVLGILIAAGDALPNWAVSALILLNPADVFRLLNLGGSGVVALGTGTDIAGSTAGLGPPVLSAALGLWLSAAGGLAWLAFRRREI